MRNGLAAALIAITLTVPCVGVADPDRLFRNAVSAADANAPQRGRFLVASRRVAGSVFHRSVVLLLSYGPDGAVGLIVNRPTKVSIGDLLPDVEEMKGRSELTHFGGPVEPNQMVVLIEARAQPPESMAVLDGIYASRSLESIRAVARSAGNKLRFRPYVGYAGWLAGQLDRELARGDWYVDSADSAAIFDMQAESVWPKYIDRNSGVQTRLPSIFERVVAFRFPGSGGFSRPAERYPVRTPGP
jgi:putative transcriptional regulator